MVRLIGVYFRSLTVNPWIPLVPITFLDLLFFRKYDCKSIEEAMMKVRLGGEIKKDVVEEEQSAVQSKEELFTFKIRCKEPRRLGSFILLYYNIVREM